MSPDDIAVSSANVVVPSAVNEIAKSTVSEIAATAAQSSANADWCAAIAACIGVVVAIVGAIAAIRQLRDIKMNLRLSTLNALIELENELNRRKLLCDETVRAIEIEEASTSVPAKKRAEAHRKFLEPALDNWLNAVDRLCYCIKNEYFPERDWKAEYRDYVKDIVDENPEEFGANSVFTNIIDINDKWRRE